jgi:hypothetical protein
MFKWLNKQGVESDAGFVVQRTGRFTCDYTEDGLTLEIEVEGGQVGGQPCISILRNAFAKWPGKCKNGETEAEQQIRLLENFKEAMKFQGLSVIVY